jgi:methionyl-tRNA formyltransferase
VLSTEGGELVVACGDGALAVREVQRPGGRRTPAAAWLQSRPVAAGDRLGG